MDSFVIYNSASGKISGVCTLAHVGDIEAAIAANTPAGLSALAVDPTHAVLTSQAGWKVSDGALVAIVPSDAELLAAAQAAQLVILSSRYEAAKTENATYMGTSFMGDADSQQVFANAANVYGKLGATPADFFAVDASYNMVPMTLDQLDGLTSVFAAQYWTAFQRWVAVRQALATATTVAAVQAVVW